MMVNICHDGRYCISLGLLMFGSIISKFRRCVVHINAYKAVSLISENAIGYFYWFFIEFCLFLNIVSHRIIYNTTYTIRICPTGHWMSPMYTTFWSIVLCHMDRGKPWDNRALEPVARIQSVYLLATAAWNWLISRGNIQVWDFIEICKLLYTWIIHQHQLATVVRIRNSTHMSLTLFHHILNSIKIWLHCNSIPGGFGNDAKFLHLQHSTSAASYANL